MSNTTNDSAAALDTLAATTTAAPDVTSAATMSTSTSSSTVPASGAWIMTFDATYEVENYRICNDSLGVYCPASAEVHGEVSFENPTGSTEVYFQDVGSATQTQTTSYGGCSKTGSVVLEVDVAVTVTGNDWLMWFGGGGFADGPFIDTVFPDGGCGTNPLPASFFFDRIVIPATEGTYQMDVSDFPIVAKSLHGQITNTDLSPSDGEKRIHLTIVLKHA